MAKRRGAIVGYGFIAEKGHVPAYRASALEIVAVADTCEARRRAAQAALPEARIYEDHVRLLEGEARRAAHDESGRQDAIEFVDITTPPYVHAEIAHAAMERGLHVMCEKPLATTAADARALVAHAKKAQRVIFPAHNYKHAPVIKAVRQVIESGRIGTVHHVTLDTFRNTHARGVREWKESWRRERKYSGGGIAMDHGSHTFYLAFEWLRAYPTAITAKAIHGGADTEHTLTTTVSFPTGTATAHLTWASGFRKVIYTVHGDKGAIRVEDDDVEVIVRASGNADGNPPITWDTQKELVSSDWMDASHTRWFESLLAQFDDTIVKRDFAGKEAEDALRCIELIEAAYASAADGCRELALAR